MELNPPPKKKRGRWTENSFHWVSRPTSKNKKDPPEDSQPESPPEKNLNAPRRIIYETNRCYNHRIFRRLWVPPCPSSLVSDSQWTGRNNWTKRTCWMYERPAPFFHGPLFSGPFTPPNPRYECRTLEDFVILEPYRDPESSSEKGFMKPKYYALRWWLYTPSSSDKVIGSLENHYLTTRWWLFQISLIFTTTYLAEMLGPHWWQTYVSFQNGLVQLKHQQLDYNMEVIPTTVFVAFFSNQRFGRGASCETTSCGKARPFFLVSVVSVDVGYFRRFVGIRRWLRCFCRCVLEVPQIYDAASVAIL